MNFGDRNALILEIIMIWHKYDNNLRFISSKLHEGALSQAWFLSLRSDSWVIKTVTLE